MSLDIRFRNSTYKIESLARRILNEMGFQVRRGPGFFDFLRSRKIDTVLDVGANVVQFGRRLRALGYNGDIVSFEPITLVFRELAAAAARDRRWFTRQIALGDTNGRAEYPR